MSAVSKIEQARRDRGLTRSEVAAKLEMSERQVIRLERGETPVRRVHLLALAEIYGVSPDDLEEAA